MPLDSQDFKMLSALSNRLAEIHEAINSVASHIEWGVKTMKTICPWCFQTSDWIDTVSTKCPECTEPALPGLEDKSQWVNRQTADGIIAYRRAKALKGEARERLRDS
jgi:hypothetical protein